MADDPTLPFSALNQQPGVSGLTDIDLPIGDILDGIQSIQDTIFGLDDLADALDGELGDAFADAIPADEIATAVVGPADATVQQLLDAVTAELSQVVQAQRVAVTDAVDETEQQILDALAGDLDDISVVVEGVDIDEQELADELEDELDLPGDGGTVINFDSVFGAVASTIEESFELALDALIGDPADLPGDIDSVIDALAALLEQTGQLPQPPDIPDSTEISTVLVQELVNLPGGDILGDPNQFVDAQIDRVTDGLVDADAQQNLAESIEGAP